MSKGWTDGPPTKPGLHVWRDPNGASIVRTIETSRGVFFSGRVADISDMGVKGTHSEHAPIGDDGPCVGCTPSEFELRYTNSLGEEECIPMRDPDPCCWLREGDRCAAMSEETLELWTTRVSLGVWAYPKQEDGKG